MMSRGGAMRVACLLAGIAEGETRRGGERETVESRRCGVEIAGDSGNLKLVTRGDCLAAASESVEGDSKLRASEAACTSMSSNGRKAHDSRASSGVTMKERSDVLASHCIARLTPQSAIRTPQ